MNIGIDILDVDEFKENILANINACERIYNLVESNNSAQKLASIFAIKEATFKALSLNSPWNFKELEVLHDSQGKPFIKFQGSLSLLNQKSKIDLSVSHTSKIVVAVVIII